MNRYEKVFEIVKDVYTDELAEPTGFWMWNNHVQWVATKTKVLAEKYNAKVEFAVSAALLHDIGDAKYADRSHEDFDNWCVTKGYDVLSEAGFNDMEAKEIIEIIVDPHSCRPGNLPTTIEGRVLATADAMFHLQTNFFLIFFYEHMPKKTQSVTEWQDWFDEKVERDYGVKIFFEDERKEVEEDYKALKKVFGNRSLEEINT